jgi:putative membrane protein
MNSRLLGVYFKGMAMGAADIVPGVSGGTIAFITGIYEELIETLQSINPKTALVLFKEGPIPFWQAINGTFIVTLLAGIITSFVSLAHVITYLLANFPIVLWSFFFGLVAASSFLIGKSVNHKCPMSILALLIGGGLALWVTMAAPQQVSPDKLTIFFAGAIAICAMILPGISGSFILVLLGLYAFILESVKSLDLGVAAVFAAGCATGLLSFVHLIAWLLKKYHSMTIGLLTGFLIGSLNALWPWKHVLEYYQSSKGPKPLIQENILPWQFSEITGQDSMMWFAIAAAVMGLMLVLGLEKMSLLPEED